MSIVKIAEVEMQLSNQQKLLSTTIWVFVHNMLQICGRKVAKKQHQVESPKKLRKITKQSETSPKHAVLLCKFPELGRVPDTKL